MIRNKTIIFWVLFLIGSLKLAFDFVSWVAASVEKSQLPVVPTAHSPSTYYTVRDKFGSEDMKSRWDRVSDYISFLDWRRSGGDERSQKSGLKPMLPEPEHGWDHMIPMSLVNYSNQQKAAATIRKMLHESAVKEKPISSFYFPNYTLDALPYIDTAPSSVVADIGCGTGLYEIAALEKRIPFHKILAVDQNEPNLAMLRLILGDFHPDRGGKIDIVTAQANNVPLPENSVDVMVNINNPFLITSSTMAAGIVRKPIGDDDANYRYLSSAFRSLKDSGTFHDFAGLEDYGDDVKAQFPELMKTAYESLGMRMVKSEVVRLKNVEHFHGMYQKASAVREPLP